MIRPGLISRAIVARKPHWLQLLLALSGVAVAAGGRWLVDRGVHGVPFATFVPVIVLSTILLDTVYAALVTVASIVVVSALFLGPWYASVGVIHASFLMFYLLTCGSLMVFGATLRRSIRELDAQSAQLRTFNEELRHRMRNTLQLVQSIARSTARNSPPDIFLQALTGRLEALSRANEMLGRTSIGTARLHDLVAEAISPFEPGRFSVSGPDCRLAEDSSMPLMLALHELCTNAHKHGALSVQQGRVTIAWDIAPDGTAAKIHWREQHGPTVIPPTRYGLGSRILRPQGGMRHTEMRFDPAGLHCVLEVRTA